MIESPSDIIKRINREFSKLLESSIGNDDRFTWSYHKDDTLDKLVVKDAMIINPTTKSRISYFESKLLDLERKIKTFWASNRDVYSKALRNIDGICSYVYSCQRVNTLASIFDTVIVPDSTLIPEHKVGNLVSAKNAHHQIIEYQSLIPLLKADTSYPLVALGLMPNKEFQENNIHIVSNQTNSLTNIVLKKSLKDKSKIDSLNNLNIMYPKFRTVI